MPVSQSEEPNELVTPTGAALVAEFSESFGPMRALTAEKIGYGIGTRDNRTRPNVLRAVLGPAAVETETHDWETDQVTIHRDEPGRHRAGDHWALRGKLSRRGSPGRLAHAYPNEKVSAGNPGLRAV